MLQHKLFCTIYKNKYMKKYATRKKIRYTHTQDDTHTHAHTVTHTSHNVIILTYVMSTNNLHSYQALLRDTIVELSHTPGLTYAQC